MKKSFMTALMCAAFVFLLFVPSLRWEASAISPKAELSILCPDSVDAGETFTLSLSVQAQDGFSFGAWYFALIYDESALSYVSGADAAEAGRLLFCDSTSAPSDTLKIEVQMQANRAGLTTLSVSKFQLVDFESMQFFECAAEERVLTVACRTAFPGDFDGDGAATSDDAIYLLYHTLYSESYPVWKNGDLNGDEVVSSDDAIYLLYHTLYPEDYPVLS